MTLNLSDYQVMLQHLTVNPNYRKVKFSNHSESGYSTTASTDEETPLQLRKMATRQQASDRSTIAFDTYHPRQNSKYYAQTYNSHSNMTSLSMTPSPTSPLSMLSASENEGSYYYVGTNFDNSSSYYDPLDLSTLPHSDKSDLEKWVKSGSEEEAKKIKKRGILKKTKRNGSESSINSELAPQTISSDIESLPFNYGSPTKSADSPIKVPALYATHKTPSPLGSTDAYRSAFTPVIPRSHRSQSSSEVSDISSCVFTPVKGPAVLDYVTSLEGLNDPDLLKEPTKRSPLMPISKEPSIDQIHPIPAPRKHHVWKATRDVASLHINDNNDSHSNTSFSCGSSSSPVPKVETLINESVRVRQFFESATAKDLKKFLEDKLDTKDPKIIKALATLFPVTVAKQVKSHCTRCHKSFDPNQRSRCYLPHPECMVHKVAQDELGADFACQCCSTGFRLLKMDFYEESTNSILTGHCYMGEHTTEPESVDYREDGGAAKSCEENGCVEFYV